MIFRTLQNKEVKVEFNGDEKVNDAGGLLREWMSLTIKELVNPNLGNNYLTYCLPHNKLSISRFICEN